MTCAHCLIIVFVVISLLHLGPPQTGASARRFLSIQLILFKCKSLKISIKIYGNILQLHTKFTLGGVYCTIS